MRRKPAKTRGIRNRRISKENAGHGPELDQHQRQRQDRAAIAEDHQQQLAATQKQISTGYRVADATDDGAAYAVAQRVRSDVGALTSANQQLGNVQGLLSHHQSPA